MEQKYIFGSAFLLSAIFSLFLFIRIEFSKNVQQSTIPRDPGLYDTELADKLFKEIRIMCLVMTYSKNHETKEKHVKETWGKQCNKLVFISDQHDDELGAVTLPSMGYDFLWGKVKKAFEYAYDHYFDEADWFVKADDDREPPIHVVPVSPPYFGHRFAVENIDESYMAGGGYILSKGTLTKFITKILPNATLCRVNEDGSEDFERDERKQKRFFPVGFEGNHLKKLKDPDYWYDQSQYYETTIGSLECCSDTPTVFHYVSPMEMHMISYLTRNVHPFGFDKNSSEVLPRKLKLDEILRASDVNSNSVNFRPHPNVHNIDPSEIFQ